MNVFFVDADDVIVSALIDRPQCSDWPKVLDEAARCLRVSRVIGTQQTAFSKAFTVHRRGEFLAIPVGVSMGGGQVKPGNLVHQVYARRRIAQSILRNRAIRRIAGYQSSAFAFVAPKLFRRYSTDLSALFEHHKELKWNFDNSIFPAASFNCGPQSASIQHFDHNNLSFGLCALTPLGNFDWTKGGHLVLHSLKLVVEFPPGTTALLPSAAVEHSNIPVQAGEDRMSMAQYAAGGLFRWVAYGFKTASSLSSTAAGRARKVAVDRGVDERWEDGLHLYSTLDSLAGDYDIGS
ncbi:hypothetical protein DFP72DRAFT_819179 [Ephemerocybe angulata]|uniref:Uncharacterized protein n=1 Tax=Ephemerocybe angulata TaxID=980116 RepID=A0A8H6HN10_9AGAR|nr:hypothetical protein DFP72DRAFT_819179 [Tulosesus angulatus]